MNSPILGVETEYGLSIEDRGAATQVEDSRDFVGAYMGPAFVGWDYRNESPRTDLRGFKVEHLAFDPVDAEFDQEPVGPPDVVRNDRALNNGARFYNDHGHPEYATPECVSLDDLVLHDLAGEEVLRRTSAAYQAKSKREVRVYKNNTDYHGASYGTHESYLAPRKLGFDKLYQAVLPILIARQVLTGAGKVGAESGSNCTFQMSQRADFMVEAANVETLYRRPIFNTRDEPHGNEQEWIRLHVISGDANMMPTGTRLKVGLVRLAVLLAERGKAPNWRVSDPVGSFKAVSRDIDGEGRIDLEGGNWTTPRNVIEALVEAGEDILDDDDSKSTMVLAMSLLEAQFSDKDTFRRSVDWAAKLWLLNQFRESEGVAWTDPIMQSLCLEYHNLDHDEGLYFGLLGSGEVEVRPSQCAVEENLAGNSNLCRGMIRGHAIKQFMPYIDSLNWGSITWKVADRKILTKLDPGARFDRSLLDVESVEQFIECLS